MTVKLFYLSILSAFFGCFYQPSTRAQAPQDSLFKAKIDAHENAKDSIQFTNFKRKMYARGFTRQLYDVLFRDIYNKTNSGGEVAKIETNPFVAYEGRVIHRVYVRRLDVFGFSVYDTTRKSDNYFENIGNKLHRNTREGVIRHNYLLFQEGDYLNAEKMRDNERLLRSLPVFHDARILVVPYNKTKGFVDVYVITQDVWSLLPDAGFGGFDRFQIGLEQRNFRGMGHTLRNEFRYQGRDTIQKYEFRTRYLIPTIGKTYVSAQADIVVERDLNVYALRFFRPFLTPETMYAGALEMSHNRVRRYEFVSNRSDSVVSFLYNYNLFDAWVGRSFKLFFGSADLRARARLVLAVRYTAYDYLKRPRLQADTNQIYQDTRATLVSLGFSNRRYQRDLLIYGFGRTEDVPTGSLAAGEIGFDNAELGQRVYLGFNYSKARYYKFGYMYGLVNVGGFAKKRGLEQGVLNLETNYFTNLKTLGRDWNARYFLTLKYTLGIGRFPNEYFNITERGAGFEGVSSSSLRGTKKLVFNFESVFFSPINFLGFRVAPFAFTNLGLVAFDEQPLFKSPVYQGFGVGFRFRNENLTFDTFQIRLGFYPNVPNNPNALRFAFDGIAPLRFRDFNTQAPEIVQFR